jgi:cysteine protease ATG4
MGLESVSDPEEIDIDLDEPADEGVDAEGEVIDVGDDKDGDGEQFFDTRSASTSSGGAERTRGKSEEVDTEEDPVDPITPGPGTRTFDIGVQGDPNGKVGGKGDGDGRREEGFESVEDDIEDDWVDSGIPGAQSPQARPQKSKPPVAIMEVPALAKGKSKKAKKGKKGTDVVSTPPAKANPSPGVNQGQQQQQQQHYPFPVSQKSADEAPLSPQDEFVRNLGGAGKGKRMHTTRARDGGRTQSGGVKGVLPVDE